MQTMKLGDVTIARVIEIDRSSFPTASMLPDSTAEAVAAHYHWLKPHFFDERTGDLASRIQTYVVRTPRHTVLIDTGVGNDKTRMGAPAWHMRASSYLDDLAAVGVTPEQVDFVLCTHLHVDHVGWNTRWRDGRWVPTFPKAKYVIAGAEWEFWKYESDAGKRALVANVGEILPPADPLRREGAGPVTDSDQQAFRAFMSTPTGQRLQAIDAALAKDLLDAQAQIADVAIERYVARKSLPNRRAPGGGRR